MLPLHFLENVNPDISKSISEVDRAYYPAFTQCTPQSRYWTPTAILLSAGEPSEVRHAVGCLVQRWGKRKNSNNKPQQSNRAHTYVTSWTQSLWKRVKSNRFITWSSNPAWFQLNIKVKCGIWESYLVLFATFPTPHSSFFSLCKWCWRHRTSW